MPVAEKPFPQFKGSTKIIVLIRTGKCVNLKQQEAGIASNILCLLVGFQFRSIFSKLISLGISAGGRGG
jgi:hypothetical protein